MYRERPASRLLLVDPLNAVLLFHFAFEDGRTFWATPGGAVEGGESYREAAQRELLGGDRPRHGCGT